ncbi:hypothetical protein KIL84_001622 [Mauremys mutica]|uniref:Uncharacterized protein n=1 Tax=Mauremys mutica TaxID=74926 RepID=A0A9D4B424_9SAUR|nr:hypothetical protein KIL84_001622 [Mauremys mutica]
MPYNSQQETHNRQQLGAGLRGAKGALWWPWPREAEDTASWLSQSLQRVTFRSPRQLDTLQRVASLSCPRQTASAHCTLRAENAGTQSHRPAASPGQRPQANFTGFRGLWTHMPRSANSFDVKHSKCYSRLVKA